jgi:hypothetical protein
MFAAATALLERVDRYGERYPSMEAAWADELREVKAHGR